MKEISPGRGSEPTDKFLRDIFFYFLKSQIIVKALENNVIKFYVVLVVHHFEKKYSAK